MSLVKLRNGTEEPQGIVVVVQVALEDLFQNFLGIRAVYELRKKIRDPNYQITDPDAVTLEDAGLLDPNGIVHDSIGNVVISALEGEGADMHLIHPVAPAVAAAPSTPPQP